jgi:hypothetical protein
MVADRWARPPIFTVLNFRFEINSKHSNESQNPNSRRFYLRPASVPGSFARPFLGL